MEAVDGLHDGAFGIVIQSGCGLVKDKDLRVVVKGAGDADSLSLAAGKAHAPVSHAGVQLLRHLFHEFLHLRLCQHLPNPVVVNLIRFHAEGDVLPQGIVRQEDGLGDVADVGKPGGIIVEYIFSAAGDGSLLHLQKPHQDVDGRGLACAGGPHHAHALPDGDAHIGILQHVFRGVGIGVGDVIHADLILHGNGRGVCVILILILPVFGIVAEIHIFIDIIQGRLKECDIGHVAVEAVDTGNQTGGRVAEGRDLGHHSGQILIHQNIDSQISQNTSHADGLDQKPGDVVEHVVFAGHLPGDLGILPEIPGKKRFPVQDFHILDTVDGLKPPFSHAALHLLGF